jgi:hypothetical protein
MTRNLLLVVSFFSLLLLAPVVYAENVTTESAHGAPTAATTNTAAGAKQQVQLLHDQKKTAIAQIKNETKTMIQTKRDEFKTHVAEIKDQTKRLLVEKIDIRITEVNATRTARFTDILNRLQTFIDHANKTASVTASLANIKAAQAAVDAAKDAVATQTAKSYVMTIADDSTLKVNAGAIVSQFRHDLLSVYDLVLKAKQVVQKLYIVKDVIRKDATSSAR